MSDDDFYRRWAWVWCVFALAVTVSLAYVVLSK